MEKFKLEIIWRMKSVFNLLDCGGLNSDERIAYSKDLEALAKAYAALEGKDVTL